MTIKTITAMSSKRIIEIEEHGSSEDAVELSSNDAIYLREGPFRGVIDLIGSVDNAAGKYKVKCKNYVGVIDLERLTLRVVPKKNVGADTILIYALRHTEGFFTTETDSGKPAQKSFLYDATRIFDLEEEEGFFDILGEIYLSLLEELLKRGLLKTHVSREGNLRFLRGKLLINRQLINDLRKMPKFYCRYSDFTYDNLENRILVKTLETLISRLRYRKKTREKLVRYYQSLRRYAKGSEVSLADFRKIIITRLNQHYKDILDLSELILENTFIRSSEQGGVGKGFNFMMDMDKLYERFVSQLIEEIVEEKYAGEYAAIYQYPLREHLFEEWRSTKKPDVCITGRDGSEVLVIIDMKNKSAITADDYYQLNYYIDAISTARVCCVIHPGVGEKTDRRLFRGRCVSEMDEARSCREDVLFLTRKLSLTFDGNEDQGYAGYEQYIEKMKERAGEIVETCIQHARQEEVPMDVYAV